MPYTLQQNGCKVDAIDLSEEMRIQWATERAKESKVTVNFIQDNIFDVQLKEGNL